MSLISDVLGSNSGYDQAAKATAGGLQAGYNAAVPFYDAGRAAINQDYTKALAPFTSLSAKAAPGVDAYGRALGLDPNSADAQKIIESTPGFQGQLGLGLKAIDRGAASRGLTTSGNTLMAEQKYGNDLASQYWNNYTAALQPYLGVAQNAAAGQAGVLTRQGDVTNASYGNQGNLGFNTQAGIGQAYAAGDVAKANADASFLNGVTNLGAKLIGGSGQGTGTSNPTSYPNLGFGTPFLNGGFGVS